MIDLKEKFTEAQKEHDMKIFGGYSSEARSIICESFKEKCTMFFKTEEYKSGDTFYLGYIGCCDECNFCGGMSGWVIFLIIVLVLGVLAGGAAAFWFFYGKRKFGGQEETVEEDTESIKNQKSVIEIP